MILLTGGTGSLGKILLSKLIESDFEVALVVRNSTQLSAIETTSYGKSFRVLTSESKSLRQLFASGGVTAVVHSATEYARGSRGEISDFPNLIECNIDLPLRIAKLCQEFKSPNFINIDSFYSFSNLIGELSLYSKSKSLARERLSKIQDLKVINLICHHVYGPNDKSDKFVTKMTELLLLDTQNIDLTDGKQIRDFIFVEDVASAIIAILSQMDSFPIGTSNVDCGSGCPTSIKEFMLLLKRVSGANTNLNFGALELQSGESIFCVAEISKLVSLGWKPKVSLEMGLRRVVESRMQP